MGEEGLACAEVHPWVGRGWGCTLVLVLFVVVLGLLDAGLLPLGRFLVPLALVSLVLTCPLAGLRSRLVGLPPQGDFLRTGRATTTGE